MTPELAEVAKTLDHSFASESAFTYVHEAVRRQATLSPRQTAVIDQSGASIDYETLCAKSRRLAQRLQNAGVGVEDRVAVLLDRSTELIVSILGILEAGAVYVPIDTSYPPERIRLILEDSGAGVLISNLDSTADLVAAGVAVIEPIAPESEPVRITDVEPALSPDCLAYVIYTSGSTGVPKGVAMSHRGLSRLIRWQLDDGPRGLTTLQFTPVCFDVTLQEVFSTLCSGGSLVLVSDADRRNPEQLVAALADKGIQRLFLPYVALQQLAKASQHLGVVPHSLQHVITAGERLIITEAISELFSALPDCRLENHYGPTEAHLVTSFLLSQEIGQWPSLPPIGKAVTAVTLYNLDHELKPVPEGEPGELYVGGDGLARGYLNAPELTAERFVPNPFSTDRGSQMYRTGDLVRINADGIVDFVGRADDQIKVRGFRVEPAEVELTLTNHPHVRQAVVRLQSLTSDINALVAYVVTDGTSLSASDLSAHLRGILPEYMVPSRFVFLEQLPLTATGKIDQRLLSEVEVGLPVSEASPSGDSLVETLRKIWERVIGHDEFELDDDFFDIGGDSLLATWVVTEISHALGREFDLSILLEDSTITGIARTLEELQLQPIGSRPVSEALTLRASSSTRILFLVHPLGGELLAYQALARSIKSPMRVVGLRWRPPEEQSHPLSLAEMAAAHLDQVRSVQPAGPYLLAGWSFGGVLAYELAQQLMASGERVDFLGLFDANPVIDTTTGKLTVDRSLYDRLTKVLTEIERQLEPGEQGAELAKLLNDNDLNSLIGNTIPEGVTAKHLKRTLQITRDNVWATMNYRAVPYRGMIDLFQPESASPAIKELVMTELGKLAQGSFRSHLIPGDHYTMLRLPQVETMAREVDSALVVSVHG